MENPQLENGYTKIANEILDSFIGSRVTIPSEVRRIVDCVIRKTYGYNKKEDTISLSQFALATGLKKPSIIRAIKKGVFMNIISRTANNSAWKYRFNKDFSAWKSLAARLIISRTANGVSPTANKSLAARLPTKERKDNITKDTLPAPIPDAGDNVNWFISKFGAINPSYDQLFKRKNQRDAANRLMQKGSKEKWERFFAWYIPKLEEDEFVPVATTPAQLEDKLAGIIARAKSKQNKNKGFII